MCSCRYLAAFALGFALQSGEQWKQGCDGGTASRQLSQAPKGFSRIGPVAIGETTLDRAQELLGPARLLPRQEGQPDLVCYRAGDRFLYLDAGPSGGWQIVTAYHFSNRPRRISDVCAVLKDGALLDRLTRLSKTPQGVIASLGTPTCRSDGTLEYRYTARRTKTVQGKGRIVIDVLQTLQFEFIEGRLDRFSFYLAETL